MSLPEVLLWRELKAAPIGFRKQHPVGRRAAGNGIVVDFYCAAAKLAIEVDGISHEMGENVQRDAERDAFIAGYGIDTLRIPAADVLQDANAVAEAIIAECRSRGA